ncbi:MAG: hypothetical protein DRP46_00890 [Candidatus Zixiibacteriota bacterium]|nr:MAG: hypothetical protein DRP46_00890 [candidate division Zixibacteria bacterium]
MVIDMQKYFLDPVSHAYVESGPAITQKIKALQDCCLGRNIPVVQTRHINTKEGAKRMDRWWGDLITADNPLSQISNDLKCDKATIITKEQYDAFLDTGLEQLLKKQGISQLIITGVLTHLCCESTARSAFMRGFEVFFAVDGTASYNEQFHLAALLNLSHGFAVPVLTSEIIEQLESRT